MPSREAVIVSTARTPIGKAYRGAFNNTEAPTLGGHAVRHAVERAGLDPAIEECRHVAPHGVEDVDQPDDAPVDVDVLAAQLLRIPVTVPSLVVFQRDDGRGLEQGAAGPRQDPLSCMPP